MTRRDLGPIGITLHSGNGTWEELLGAAPELEAMGYATVWLAGGVLSDLGRIGEVVRATREVPVGSAIVPVSRFPATAVAETYAQLQASHPDRFIVGLGGADGPRPLQDTVRYLDQLDAAPPGVPAPARMLAALGPRMLELARDRTAGTVPLLVTPEHTAKARALLGEDATLIVLHYVVVEPDPAAARQAGRRPLGFLRGVGGYAANFRRMGFTEDDVADLSDRMVDALVAWGDPATIAARVGEHLAAGADQVSLVVLPTDGQPTVPTASWRRLAEACVPERQRYLDA